VNGVQWRTRPSAGGMNACLRVWSAWFSEFQIPNRWSVLTLSHRKRQHTGSEGYSTRQSEITGCDRMRSVWSERLWKVQHRAELSAISQALVSPHGVNTLSSAGLHTLARAMAPVMAATFEINQGGQPSCCARPERVPQMIQVTAELGIFLSQSACAIIGKARNCMGIMSRKSRKST